MKTYRKAIIMNRYFNKISILTDYGEINKVTKSIQLYLLSLLCVYANSSNLLRYVVQNSNVFTLTSFAMVKLCLILKLALTYCTW